MDQETFKCPKCDCVGSLQELSFHCDREHDLNNEQLYVELKHEGVWPSCACGCGEKIEKFWDLKKGFSKFRRGHHSRIKNNWGHNTKAREKSLETRREMWDKGEIRIWTKGKTKDDPGIARMIEAGRQTILSNPDELKRRAESMRENRLSRRIPSPSGSQHGNWRGGVSTVQMLARSHLYSVWTFPKLKEQNFTCQRCGSHENLCVHHDGERFAEILQKAREVLGDVTEDFSSHQAYAQWIADYHVKNNVSGIVLCEKCHSKEHATLVI